jgi:hypothetical protein
MIRNLAGDAGNRTNYITHLLNQTEEPAYD